VTITAPGAGDHASYNLPVSITVTNGDGATVTVTTTPSGGAAQSACAGGTVANGAFSCNGTFVPGPQTLTVTVTDAAGNSSSQSVNINIVNAPGCAFAFTTPSGSNATLTPADDLQAAVADLQYRFTAASTTSGCGNKTVKMFRNGTEIASLAGTTNSAGVYTSPVVTEPDSAGATILWRAEIDDGAGNKTSANVSVVVVLTNPLIVLPTNNTNLNTTRDLDGTVAGVQAQLQYTPAAPTGFTATACSSVQFNGAAACPTGNGFVLATNLGQNTPTFTFPDGSYDMWIEFVNTAGTAAPIPGFAQRIHVNVESIHPTVTAFTYQGNTNGDAHLNATEQASGDPVAILAISGANGGTVVVRRTDTNAIVSGATPVTITGGAATLTLSGLNASSSTFEAPAFNLAADVTTALGSKNIITAPPPTGQTLNTAALSTIRIDRVAPTCALTEPAKAQLGLADDASSGTAGYQVRVAGTTATDVGATGVTLDLTPTAGTAQTQATSPTGAAAGAMFTPVAQTGETDYTAGCQATDLSGNVGTRVSRAVRVDLAPPTCTIVTPNAGASPYTTSYIIATQVTVGGGNGLKCRIYSTPTAGTEQLLGDMDVVSGAANGSFVYLSGQQTVRAEVTDAAGNSCTGAGSTAVITVSAPGCSIQFNKPAAHPNYLTAADDTNTGTPTTLDYTLTGVTSCPNQSIQIFVNNTLVGTPTTNGSGNFSQAVSGIAEGVVTFRGDMNVGTATSNTWAPTVDLTLPVIVSTTPATNPTGSTLHFVAPTNKNLVPPANPAYVKDTDTGTAGAQATISVHVTGAAGGTVTILDGSNTAGGPIPVVTADETDGVPINLTHNTTPTLTIRVVDAAGNTLDRVVSGVVDVIAPAVPPNTVCNVVIGKEREAKINLAWDPSYDDGSTSTSGQVQYDVRWTNTTVAPAGLATSDDFFDSAKTYQDAAAVAWSASRINREIPVPTFTSYYCFVRAYDEEGNYSPLTASVSTDKVDNLWTKNTFSNPHASAAAAQQFGRVMAAGGSLNNDGVDDLAVGFGQQTTTNPERVFIYYGNATAATFAAQTPQSVSAPDGVTNGNFGFDVSMGNVGDATLGDNKADLLVGAPLANSSAGRAYLFFGSTTSATLDTSGANAVVFQGAAASQLGISAQIVGDMNGDNLSEILLVANLADGGRGRAYLYYGRSRTAWLALQTAGLGVIDVSVAATQADREFLGPTPVANGTYNFGRMRPGITSVGSDLAIPASTSSVNRLYIWAAATVNAGSAGAANAFLSGFEPGTTNSALQTMLTPAAGTTTFLEGYGSRAQSNFNAVGTASIDLLVGEPNASKVHLYADRSVSNLFSASPTTSITCPTCSRFGIDARAANYSTTGGADLFVGETNLNGYLWYFHNRDVSGSEFDTNTNSGFFHSKYQGTRIGLGLANGDFNGDGKPDIAASDISDGNGKVFVWF
jgi:hypothetical protein